VANILIAEDEERIASFLDKGLRSAGFGVTTVSNGVSALNAIGSGEFDLLLLDIGLPKLDGLEVLRNLRETGDEIAVIVLTARDSAVDTVSALEEGANDYMSKPFRFDDLLARVRLRLQDASSKTTSQLLECGDLSLDLRTRRVTVDGREVDLSAREFGLAQEFIQNAEQVLSREQLLSRVWGFDYDPGSNVVEVYVRYLRRKIGAARLETVRGMGYRLTASVSVGPDDANAADGSNASAVRP